MEETEKYLNPIYAPTSNLCPQCRKGYLCITKDKCYLSDPPKYLYVCEDCDYSIIAFKDEFDWVKSLDELRKEQLWQIDQSKARQSAIEGATATHPETMDELMRRTKVIYNYIINGDL